MIDGFQDVSGGLARTSFLGEDIGNSLKLHSRSAHTPLEESRASGNDPLEVYEVVTWMKFALRLDLTLEVKRKVKYSIIWKGKPEETFLNSVVFPRRSCINRQRSESWEVHQWNRS